MLGLWLGIESAFAEGLPDGTAAPVVPAHDVLVAAAASLDVALRGAALEALIAEEAEPCQSPWTRRGMFDPAPSVQRHTLQALDRPGGSPCKAELWTWATSPSLDAHTRAIAAVLSGEQDAEKIGALAMALRADGRSALFLWAAGVRGHAGAQARLEEIARAGNLPLEPELYTALGLSPTFPFAAAFEAAEPEAQPWIAAAWFDADPRAARATVRRLLHDADEGRVFDTIEALLDDPSAVPLLRRVTGVDAKLASLRFPALARRALDDTGLDRRLDAVRTLAGPAAQASDRALLRARYAEEDDDTVRVAIARAVAESATEQDREILTRMLADPVFDARVVAAIALYRLFPESRAPGPPGVMNGPGTAPVPPPPSPGPAADPSSSPPVP